MTTVPGSSPRPQAPPPLPQQLKPRRELRLASAQAHELGPVWTQPFGRLLLGQVAPVVGKTTLLDVMCHSGYPGLELLRRFPEARLFAVDPSAALIEQARRNAGELLGRRVFLRTEPGEPNLPFDEAVYDLVVSNLGLYDAAQPQLLLKELARVAKPGAQVVATLPLRGTFAEFYALLEAELTGREVERKRLLGHLQSWPDVETVRGWAKLAGLDEIELVVSPFSLLFAGAAELFYSPLIEHGPMPALRALCGDSRGEQQAVFSALRERIEQICGGEGKDRVGLRSTLRKPLVLTVRAACLRARRPL